MNTVAVLQVAASPRSIWEEPGIIAAIVAAGATLTVMGANALVLGWREGRSRDRDAFAKAFADCVAYREFPYAIRRRRLDQPETERVRISEELRDLQGRIAYHQAWISTHSGRVARAYDEMLRETRLQAGGYMRTFWNEPPIADDAGMNISGVDLSSLKPYDEAFLQAVGGHLSFWPSWIRKPARKLAMLLRRG